VDVFLAFDARIWNSLRRYISHQGTFGIDQWRPFIVGCHWTLLFYCTFIFLFPKNPSPSIEQNQWESLLFISMRWGGLNQTWNLPRRIRSSCWVYKCFPFFVWHTWFATFLVSSYPIHTREQYHYRECHLQQFIIAINCGFWTAADVPLLIIQCYQQQL
jgi:hypothetical protein